MKGLTSTNVCGLNVHNLSFFFLAALNHFGEGFLVLGLEKHLNVSLAGWNGLGGECG